MDPRAAGEPPSRAALWIGALARTAAFIALLVLFAIVFGAAWAVLPLPTDGAWLFAGTSVTAAAAVAAGVVLLRYADQRPAAALGIGVSRETPLHIGAGVVIGAVALLVAAGGMLVSGSLRYTAEAGSVGGWMTTVVAQGTVFTIAAFAEEAIFRGYPFQVLVRVAGPVVAIALSSVLFAAAHAANPEVGAFALFNIFLAGVLLAVAYLRTLSLWFATALHMGWNWTMATLLDLPVSGIAEFDTPGYDALVGGPDWWSGGAFGPEGGLVGTIGFGAALLALVMVKRLRPDPAIAAASPLVLDRERAGDVG
jgi:uncharacterized protein